MSSHSLISRKIPVENMFPCVQFEDDPPVFQVMNYEKSIHSFLPFSAI